MTCGKYPIVILSVAVTLISGCRPGELTTDESAGSDLFGAPVHHSLLEPFQGEWKYDFDRTVAVWESQGVPAEQIAAGRKLRENPVFAKLGETLTIDGHVASGVPFAFSEYRMFGLHEHDGAVCGRAWHHEDADDPGDMSKCYVKLRLVDGALHLEVWMAEELPDLDDPDLTSPPAVVSGSAKDCDAPTSEGDERNGWATSVYVRAE